MEMYKAPPFPLLALVSLKIFSRKFSFIRGHSILIAPPCDIDIVLENDEFETSI